MVSVHESSRKPQSTYVMLQEKQSQSERDAAIDRQGCKSEEGATKEDGRQYPDHRGLALLHEQPPCIYKLGEGDIQTSLRNRPWIDFECSSDRFPSILRPAKPISMALRLSILWPFLPESCHSPP